MTRASCVPERTPNPNNAQRPGRCVSKPLFFVRGERGLVRIWLIVACLASCLLAACRPALAAATMTWPTPSPSPVLPPQPTPSERPPYAPGELVDYLAQTGDTLPALAAHFNTTVAEILQANDFIPAAATTLPPGMPMKIPIYYTMFYGSAYKILPDSLFINGPAQIGFDAETFVAAHPGWLNGYREYAAGSNRSGAQIVNLVAQNFSISPRLLLALLEYQAGALSQPLLAEDARTYPLGYTDWQHPGLYLQLVWAANTLNNGYYGYRTARLTTFELADGRLQRPDPWQNAASVALQYYFAQLLNPDDYTRAIEASGFAQTYTALFGDPWLADQPHIPGSLAQPPFRLPFQAGHSWTLTGGPHTAWGQGDPLAALDFAPPGLTSGCFQTLEQAIAVAPGLVVRSGETGLALDLDQDGDERTGWVVFYLHLAQQGRASLGTKLQAGDPLGYPSCEGGSATGTHIHIARKYNGEWIPADGILAFNLEGWVAHNGSAPYLGSLTRFSQTVTACQCSDKASQITSQASP